MTEWIIPCNPGIYDVIGAFNALDMIDWKQSTKKNMTRLSSVIISFTLMA